MASRQQENSVTDIKDFFLRKRFDVVSTEVFSYRFPEKCTFFYREKLMFINEAFWVVIKILLIPRYLKGISLNLEFLYHYSDHVSHHAKIQNICFLHT